MSNIHILADSIYLFIGMYIWHYTGGI